MNRFFPELHFTKPSEKLSPEFCRQCVDYFYHNTGNVGLLDNKDVKEIDSYADGTFSLDRFKKMMFKSARTENKQACDKSDERVNDLTWIDSMTPLALIPMKLNSAVSTAHNIPVEITCKANDITAAEKIEEDIRFLKNKPIVEADLQPLADQIGLGKVDLGETRHSEKPYSSSPYGLDLNDPEELDVFRNIEYKLGVVAAFETGLTEYWNLKEADEVRALEIRDQFKYGVSCHQAYQSAITGLPDIDYVHPSEMMTPETLYNDFRDNTHRIRKLMFTPIDLMNKAGDCIKSEDHLDEILNNETSGYCVKNGRDVRIERHEWSKVKLHVLYFEVKSIDWIGVAKKPSKKGRNFMYLTEDEVSKDGVKCSGKIWGQNTYCFYWLKNTDTFFGIGKLGFSHRTRGLESFQNFSTNINRSQKKSAVELSIGENQKAQLAEIKLNHYILKSQPPGKEIDLAFFRNAAMGLKGQDGNLLYKAEDLVSMIFEENISIGDSVGADGAAHNARPTRELEGGLQAEIVRYFEVIERANLAIARITGINDQLTGASSNPEALVGMQKLLINQSINSLKYCTRAINSQYKKLFPLWAYVLKSGIESGGKVKEMMEKLIGAKKVSLIDRLKELSLHEIGVTVEIIMREEERASFRQSLFDLRQKGVINSADEFMLNSIANPRDQMALLAVKEIQFMKKMDKQRQEEMAHQQTMIQQQSESMLQSKQMEAEGRIKEVYAQGDVKANVISLMDKLQLNRDERQSLMKRILQKERMEGQKDKSLSGLREKANMDQQKAIGAI